MTLRDWLVNGQLVEHQTSKEEISELMEIADRDLQASRLDGLSPDWRFAIAYNCALQIATAALAAAGYRARAEGHHYWVIRSLIFTMRTDKGLVSQLNKFRKKRHGGIYQHAGMVSAQEVREMVAIAKKLRVAFTEWLIMSHPELAS